MYKVGDLIHYGSTGICRVSDITERGPEGMQQGYLYYVLAPLYQNYTIFVPTDTTKIFMRPIISKEEANRLIDTIPSMQVEAVQNRAWNQLAEQYKASFDTHDCSSLLELCMSIYAKKQCAEQQKRKIGAVDEKFMKRAEDLLFGELAAALDIEREQVPEYITDRIKLERRSNGNECN